MRRPTRPVAKVCGYLLVVISMGACVLMFFSSWQQGAQIQKLNLEIKAMKRLLQQQQPQYPPLQLLQQKSIAQLASNFGPELSVEQVNKLNAWFTSLSKVNQFEQIDELLPINGGGIIDIGANAGVFISYVLTRCPQCSILAFEAVPQYASFIHSRFASDKVRIVPLGLAETQKRMVLYVARDNLGWNTLVSKMAQTKKMDELDIDLIPLDAVPTEWFPSNIRLIKIDVEGAEWRVIRGARRFLSQLPRPKPPIFLEVAWGHKHAEWKEEMEELEWLMNNGWKRIHIDPNAGTRDYIFYPE